MGSFFLREDSDRPVILVGGGTGFAPVKGILEHAFYIGVTRPMHLYWGARAKRDLYMDELPQKWAEEHGNFSYTPVLSEPLPEEAWDGREGLVPAAVVDDYPDLSAFDIYIAGPPAMVKAAREVFLANGALEEHLFHDAFEFSKDAKAKASAG